MKVRKEYTYQDRECGIVCKVGINDVGKYQSHIRNENGKKVPTREYQTWTAMLNRCYSKNYHKTHPSYVGCSVSENFKSFQFFAEWCQNQIGFGELNWHLDKDILIDGNREYSENSCVFVPRKINALLNDNKRAKGVLPTGVCFSNQQNMFFAQIKKNGKSYNLGYFRSIEEAFLTYKVEKEKYIKEVAEQWKDQIDIRVYNALLDRVVRPDYLESDFEKWKSICPNI